MPVIGDTANGKFASATFGHDCSAKSAAGASSGRVSSFVVLFSDPGATCFLLGSMCAFQLLLSSLTFSSFPTLLLLTLASCTYVSIAAKHVLYISTHSHNHAS